MLQSFFKTIFCSNGVLLSILLTAFAATSFAEVSLFGGIGFGNATPGSYVTLGIPLGVRAESKKTFFLFSELSYLYLQTANSTTIPTQNDSYEEYRYKEISNSMAFSGGVGFRIHAVAVYAAPVLLIPMKHTSTLIYESDNEYREDELSLPSNIMVTFQGGVRIKFYEPLSLDIRLIDETPHNTGITCLIFGYTF